MRVLKEDGALLWASQKESVGMAYRIDCRSVIVKSLICGYQCCPVSLHARDSDLLSVICMDHVPVNDKGTAAEFPSSSQFFGLCRSQESEC